MRKRVACTLVAIALVLLLLPAQAFGQEFGDTMTESRLFNVEMGFLAGYRMLDDSEETVAGRSVGLNFAIMENAEIGVINTIFNDAEGGPEHTYNLVRFNYFLTEQLALSVSTGSFADDQGNNTAGGSVGGNFVILRSVPENGLSSTLKANVQYLMNEEDGVGEGTFAVSLMGTIGL